MEPMAETSNRPFTWIAILVVVAAAVGGGYWYYTGREGATPQFQTAPVTRGDLIQSVTATGTLNPSTNVTVGSQISGIIQKLYVDWNSPVKAGQVVAQLDPSTYQANVRSAEADLANAKANLELAQVEAKRADELFKSNLISAADHDSSIASLHQAEAQVQMKQASLDNAQVNLSRCTIYSPVDGIVISRSVDVGQTVAASLSAPTLFIIANDLTQMQIDANVSEADVGNVEEGQDVDFTVDAFPYRTFHGKVTQVRNAATTVQNVVTYDAVILVNNADLKLKPGMTATVSIIIAERPNALRIPNSALRFRMPEALAAPSPAVSTNSPAQSGGTNAPVAAAGGGRREGRGGFAGRGGAGGGFGGPGGGRQRAERQHTRTVYVLPAAKAGAEQPAPKPVEVKIGITDSISTEVIEGLNEGDQVVTGMMMPNSGPGRESSNPFGGGFPRRRR